MKKTSTYFLQTVVVIKALIIVILCIFALPHFVEGLTYEFPEIENMKSLASLFVVGLYGVSATSLFMIYYIVKIFGYVRANTFFSDASLKALKNIKDSSISLLIFFILCAPVFYAIAQRTDAPGVGVFGIMPIVYAVVLYVFTGVVEGLVKSKR